MVACDAQNESKYAISLRIVVGTLSVALEGRLVEISKGLHISIRLKAELVTWNVRWTSQQPRVWASAVRSHGWPTNLSAAEHR